MQKVPFYYILFIYSSKCFSYQISFFQHSSFAILFNLSFTVLVHYRLFNLFFLRGWYPFFLTKLHLFHFTLFIYNNLKIRDSSTLPCIVTLCFLFFIINFFAFSIFAHHYSQNLV